MRILTIICALLLASNITMAEDKAQCCKKNGGVDYCKVKTGFYICKDGTRSGCVCDDGQAPVVARPRPRVRR